MREMKDSGIELIGKIPASWCSIPLGNLVDSEKYAMVDGPFGSDLKNEEYVDAGIPIVQLNNIKPLHHSINSLKYVTIEKAISLSRHNAKAGDIVIAKMMPAGRSCILSDEYEKYVICADVIKASITDKILKKYVCYCMNSYGMMVADMQSAGTTRARISLGLAKKMRILLPQDKNVKPLVEYLDRKCSAIDNIIAKQEQIIEKLKEYKLSLITEAVTKGLDSNVELKESNIEWVGQIPVHWSKIKLKYSTYIRARLGWKGLKAEEYVETGYPLLSAFNIINSKVDFTENINYINQDRYDESPEIKLSESDILLVKDGAGIGKCGIIEQLPIPSTTNGSLAVITTNDSLLPKYLYYYFLSSVFQKYIDRIKDGMGVPHLFQSDLREIEIVIPDRMEQEAIVKELEKKIFYSDYKIKTIEEMMSRLKEYKKSIIYEVVTGKKEV